MRCESLLVLEAPWPELAPTLFCPLPLTIDLLGLLGEGRKQEDEVWGQTARVVQHERVFLGFLQQRNSLMDPFAVLPPELAVHVLLLVDRDVSLRSGHLRAALAVSRLWNAVASSPALWSEYLDRFSILELSSSVEEARRRLKRAQGVLRVLRMPVDRVATSLWEGAVQEACAGGVLEDVTLLSFPQLFAPERTALIAETVGSRKLRSLSIKSLEPASTQMLVREILHRSFHLRNLKLNVEAPNFGPVLETWLPNLSETDEQGVRPLERLETLGISLWSPSLWEHLSRLGVKLVSLSLLSVGYGLHGIHSQDESGRVLRHILDVIDGPILRDFEFTHSLLKVEGRIHPQIAASVFKHPRRSLSISLLGHDAMEAIDDIVLNPRPMLPTLEKLTLHFCHGTHFDLWFGQNHPRLRHLSLYRPSGEDEMLAKAIRATSGSLEFLEIKSWGGPKDRPVEQTLAAIGATHSLRSLILEGCAGISYSMLEPLVIGSPPNQPPLCPRIREIYFSNLCGDTGEFLERLRQSFKQRFPYDGIVNGQPVCLPFWKTPL